MVRLDGATYFFGSLLAQPRIPAATSFKTLEAAETVVSEAIRLNAGQIRMWAARAAAGQRLRLTLTSAKSIGYGVVRATSRLTEMTNAIIVLEKTNQNGKIYFILTAYPVP